MLLLRLIPGPQIDFERREVDLSNSNINSSMSISNVYCPTVMVCQLAPILVKIHHLLTNKRESANTGAMYRRKRPEVEKAPGPLVWGGMLGRMIQGWLPFGIRDLQVADRSLKAAATHVDSTTAGRRFRRRHRWPKRTTAGYGRALSRSPAVCRILSG